MRHPQRPRGGCRRRAPFLLCLAPAAAVGYAQAGDQAEDLGGATKDFGDQGYVLRRFGADGCPGGFEVGSAEECEHAALKLGLKGVEAVSSSEMPTGCVSAPTQNSQHERKGYFNSATSGSIHSSMAPICKTGMAAALGWDRCCSGHKSCGAFAGFCCPTNDQVMLGCCSGETSKYDGVYTSESSPGGDYFVIHGETVQWDAGSQSKIVSEEAAGASPAGGGPPGAWSSAATQAADNTSIGHFSTWFDNEGVARQATVVGDKIWWDAPFFQDVWLKVPKPKDDSCIAEVTFTETTTAERTATSTTATSTNTIPNTTTATPTSTTATPTSTTATPAASTTAVTSLLSTTTTDAVAAEEDEAKFDCEAGLPNWEKGWSEAKKTWCCEHESKGWHGCNGETDPALVLLEPTPTKRPRKTSHPTPAPTPDPTPETASPTPPPTDSPTAAPTSRPTTAPTAEPTEAPTARPTDSPTAAPTSRPTTAPTAEPTEMPTAAPTAAPGPEMCPDARDGYEKDVTFDPVDMDTALVGRTMPNISACQNLCANTQHCFHFSFWSPNPDRPGQCHMQDIFALRHKNRFGFWSGPKKSWCQLSKEYRDISVRLQGPEGLSFDGMGNDTYVPKEFRCFVMGGSYEPPFVSRVMPKDTSNRSGAYKYGGAVLDCQEWCRNTTGCVHFSVQYPSRTCSLANSRAKLQFPISKTVSGPVSCEGEPMVKPNCTCPDDEDGNASQEDGNASQEPSDSVVNNVELLDFPVLEQFGENTKHLPTVATWALASGALLAGVNAARFLLGAHAGRVRPHDSRIMSFEGDREGYVYSERYQYNALSTVERAP